MNGPECPRCGSNDVKKSTIRGIHEGILLLWMTPLRCHKCYERYWTSRFSADRPAA